MMQLGFGDQSLSRAQVFQWHARFKTGRTSVDDDERTGRPTTCTTPETVARIQELIRQEKPHVTKAKKGQTGEKQSQEHDHHFLWHQGDCVQRICPNRPIFEFWVLLRSFAETACKSAKTSPPASARTDLAASPWQCPVSHFRPHPPVSGEKQNCCYPPPTILPWFGTLWLLFPKMKLKLKGRRFDTIEEIQVESQRVLDTDIKGLPGSVPKMEETVGLMSACGRELLRGWRRPIGLMVSFMIFAASVWKILDQPSYVYWCVRL